MIFSSIRNLKVTLRGNGIKFLTLTTLAVSSYGGAGMGTCYEACNQRFNECKASSFYSVPQHCLDEKGTCDTRCLQESQSQAVAQAEYPDCNIGKGECRKDPRFY